MKNRYFKLFAALSMTVAIAFSASAQLKVTQTSNDRPLTQPVMTTTPDLNMSWLKSGKADRARVVKEYTSRTGRKMAVRVSDGIQTPLRATRSAEEPACSSITVTMPAADAGVIFHDVMAYLWEVDGWRSMPFFQDEQNPSLYVTPAPVGEGTYALLVTTVKEAADGEFTFFAYERVVEVPNEGLVTEVDFNDCVNKITCDMVRPDGSDYLWGTDDAPFASIDMVYSYLKIGVYGDFLVPTMVNTCDEKVKYQAIVSEISHVAPEAYQAWQELYGPYTQDVVIKVTPDMYTKTSADFTIWPSDIDGGYMGISFMEKVATQSRTVGSGSTGCAPGKVYDHVDVYATMGQTVLGDTEYASQIGTVIAFDKEYGEATVKSAGNQLKAGDDWYVVQPMTNLDKGVWTYMSVLDMFNINQKDQEIKNFAYTPYCMPNFSIWVYDDEEYIVADLGAQFDVNGMFHETVDGLNPFDLVESMTIDGEEVKPWALMEEPMPKGNMVVTYNYKDVCVEGQYPAYVKGTTAFYTFSESRNPWISGFQIRCNDKITNNIDPSLPSTMYILGYGIGFRGTMNFNIDWTCEMAAEGTDDWKPVTLNPKDSGTDYGAICEVDLASLGLEPNTWYSVRIRLADDENNYTQMEMGRCFYMNTAGGLTIPSADGDATVVGCFDLNGRRMDAPARGVNIVRYSDGSTRKVII